MHGAWAVLVHPGLHFPLSVFSSSTSLLLLDLSGTQLQLKGYLSPSVDFHIQSGVRKFGGCSKEKLESPGLLSVPGGPSFHVGSLLFSFSLLLPTPILGGPPGTGREAQERAICLGFLPATEKSSSFLNAVQAGDVGVFKQTAIQREKRHCPPSADGLASRATNCPS